MPSIFPRRAAICAHCSATLLKIRTPVLSHNSFGTGSGLQSATSIRMK